MAVDETTIGVDVREPYVRAVVDCAAFDGLRVDVSPGRSSLDALSSLTEVLQHCRSRPLFVRAGRDPWYD